MSTTRPRFAPAAEPLEERSAPASLRIVPAADRGFVGFGTAGTDPDNPSARNTELLPAADVTVPFGPRTLGAVEDVIRAFSTLTVATTPPDGLFPTLGAAVPPGRLVFDATSVAEKPGGLNGGGSTLHTHELDPNIALAPLLIDVVPDAGEQVGQEVRLSFGFQATAVTGSATVVGTRQDAGFVVGGVRTGLFSRDIRTPGTVPPLSGGRDVTVRIGDRVGLEFTQSANLAGLGSSTASARIVLGVAVGAAAGPTAAGAGAVGAGAGRTAEVQVYNDDGSLARTLQAFEPQFTGGVRVASADFTGDGVPDVIAGSGPGRAALVRVFNGATGAEAVRVEPFEPAFTGGVYVAAGDLTGDGTPDLVITPDEGGGPRVRVFEGKGFAPAADFFGIDDVNFRGGARAAVGDVTGDGRADLVVAAGFGGGPRVSVWDGKSLANGTFAARPFNDFFVFEQTLRNGVFVAAGDTDGDGFAELIAGGGPGGGPRVFALSGKALVAGRQEQRANFFAGDPDSRGGIRVATTDLDGDRRADLLAGVGPGAGARVTAYLGATVHAAGTPAAFRDFTPFPDFSGGVYVG
jgi:hypothetical protein